MTKTKDEGAEAQKREGLPNPTFEGQEDVSLPGANDVIEQIKTLQSRLEDMDKRWQSDKDRRIPQIEDRLNSFEAVLGDYNRLVQGGLNEDVAKWLLSRLDQNVTQVEQQSPQQSQSSKQGREAGVDVATEAVGKLEKYGLSVNEPKFIEILRGRYSNEDAFNSAVDRYILDRLVPGEKPVSRVAVSQGAANEEVHVEPNNPIQDIEDSRELYDIAFKDIMKKRQGTSR